MTIAYHRFANEAICWINYDWAFISRVVKSSSDFLVSVLRVSSVLHAASLKKGAGQGNRVAVWSEWNSKECALWISVTSISIFQSDLHILAPYLTTSGRTLKKSRNEASK